MQVLEKIGRWRLFLAGGGLLASAVLLYFISPALAQEAAAEAQAVVAYRTFLGIDPRSAIWVIAQVHLMITALDDLLELD